MERNLKRLTDLINHKLIGNDLHSYRHGFQEILGEMGDKVPADDYKLELYEEQVSHCDPFK